MKIIYKKEMKLLLKIFLISFLPVLLIWLPFLLHLENLFFLKIKEGGMQNILKNWDGPSYVLLAKSFYNIDVIDSLKFVSSLPNTYFFAHFPLYPFLIKILNFFINNLFYSGLLVNLIFGFFLNLLFYYFIKNKTRYPLFLTFLFTIFPPRFWITRAIIAPEALMNFLILFSLILFERKKYFISSVLGSLAVLTKVQSLFLFPAYLLVFFERLVNKKEKVIKSWFWIFLIPSSLFFLFFFYYLKIGDFLIFLKAQKDNNLYFYFPFSQFNYQGTWAGTGWLEDIIFYFLGMVLLIVSLYNLKERSFFYFSLFYSLFLFFIPQRDVTRFTYPLLPLFYWRFSNLFGNKIFKLAIFLILPALYFYSLNFILVNQAPISDWTNLIR